MVGLSPSKDQIEDAVKRSVTYKEVADILGRYPGQYFILQLKKWIRDMNIDDTHFLCNASYSRWSEHSVKHAVACSKSYTDTLIYLGVKHRSGNFDTLKNKIAEYGISVEHFDTKQSTRNKKISNGSLNTIPLDEILDGQHPSYITGLLKKRLIESGIKLYRCEGLNCGISMWKGDTLTLELDHINGKSDDHRLCNLRLLCPNCHSQTATYKGRNKKKLGALE